jgi:hypothetical protein
MLKRILQCVLVGALVIPLSGCFIGLWLGVVPLTGDLIQSWETGVSLTT